jgi:hypothetical protein
MTAISRRQRNNGFSISARKRQPISLLILKLLILVIVVQSPSCAPKILVEIVKPLKIGREKKGVNVYYISAER